MCLWFFASQSDPGSASKDWNDADPYVVDYIFGIVNKKFKMKVCFQFLKNIYI